jgi:hypothetical protein
MKNMQYQIISEVYPSNPGASTDADANLDAADAMVCTDHCNLYTSYSFCRLVERVMQVFKCAHQLVM